MSLDADFGLVVEFVDTSESFVLGFEAGMIWPRLQAGEEVIAPEVPLHRNNAEVLQRMATAAGYTLSLSRPENGSYAWVMVEFRRKPPEQRRNLRVVG